MAKESAALASVIGIFTCVYTVNSANVWLVVKLYIHWFIGHHGRTICHYLAQVDKVCTTLATVIGIFIYGNAVNYANVNTALSVKLC